jgi:hypothetical protein
MPDLDLFQQKRSVPLQRNRPPKPTKEILPMLPPLNFDDNSRKHDDDTGPVIRDDLAAFDAATDPLKVDLSAFDRADPRPVVPAGWYVCRIESGKLDTTRAGKLCYRLRFTVIDPPEFVGRTLFRTVMLHDAADQARARMLLSPLGLTSAETLRQPFPEPGKPIYVRALVVIKPPANAYPESNSIERFVLIDPPADLDPTTTPANPWAVSLGDGEGGAA